MSRWSRVSSLVLVAGAGVALACHNQPPAQNPTPQPTPPVSQGPNQDSLNRVRQDSLARAQRMADSIQAEKDRMAAGMAAVRNTLTTIIYFDYDKSDLSDQSRAALDAKVAILMANPDVHLRVEGNCDGRGSDEYNLALGQRRAAAAKRYLTDHGVDASRIDVVSNGKEKPAVAGDNDDAFAKDRNDTFDITAGGDNLKAAS